MVGLGPVRADVSTETTRRSLNAPWTAKAKTLPVLVTATLFVYGFEVLLRGLNGSSSEPLRFRIGSSAVRTSAADAFQGMATVVCVGTAGLAGTLRVSVKLPPVAFTVKVWTLSRW